MSMLDSARDLIAKFEVLRDFEDTVRHLMAVHEAKRPLWFPHDLIGPGPGESPEEHRARARRRAEGIPVPARAAVALNLLTEEGLPHFHRVFAAHAGEDSHWRDWLNLWTAEEDRHGQVLHDYVRDTGLLDQRRLEEMQFAYMRAGFDPDWDKDPYRVFVYTSVQERATQRSHAETGKMVAEYDPLLGAVLEKVAQEEARHFSFYRAVFSEVLERDPNGGLESASHILPGIDMPGVSIPGFRDFAEVIRRSGIYGPWDYLNIVREQIAFWKIEKLEGLNEMGRKAQERIMAVPDRLRRIAELIETRSRAKTFSFEVVFNREFAME
jgi:acyl-[acyl-carrier-protein] desaturase